jgi:undecaprenyl diphosphate synthase
MLKKDVKIKHIAIIPDGNRRWAKKNGILKEEEFYQKGVERIEETIIATAEYGIKFLTLWASSLSNLKGRSGEFYEVMNYFYIKEFNDLSESDMIKEEGVRIRVIGEWENNLEKETVKSIRNAICSTAVNKKRILTVLIGYDGKRERADAVVTLARNMLSGRLKPSLTIDNADVELKRCSWTRFLPEVDLIIRTGSWDDPHLSADFLTFLIGRAQLAFPRVFWPGFSREELFKIIIDYGNREQRFGK